MEDDEAGAAEELTEGTADVVEVTAELTEGISEGPDVAEAETLADVTPVACAEPWGLGTTAA